MQFLRIGCQGREYSFANNYIIFALFFLFFPFLTFDFLAQFFLIRLNNQIRFLRWK